MSIDITVTLSDTLLRQMLKGDAALFLQKGLCAALDAEANEQVGVAKYERGDERNAYRSGHYERVLRTPAGTFPVEVPKLKGATFQTGLIEKYKQIDRSLLDKLVELCLSGISVRQAEEISQSIFGASASSAAISSFDATVKKEIETWRKRKLETHYQYVYADGVYMSQLWGEGYEEISVMAAVGVKEDGKREVLAVEEAFTESESGWKQFLQGLADRGVEEIDLLIADGSKGFMAARKAVFPNAKFQRCFVHFEKNILGNLPKREREDVSRELKKLMHQDKKEDALKKAQKLIQDLEEKKYTQAAQTLKEGIHQCLTCYEFPANHRRYIYTNNMIERLNKSLRQRTYAIGAFPTEKATLTYCAYRIKCVTSSWTKRSYIPEAIVEEKGDKKE